MWAYLLIGVLIVLALAGGAHANADADYWQSHYPSDEDAPPIDFTNDTQGDLP